MHAESLFNTSSPAWLDYLTAVASMPMCEARPLSLRLHIPSFAGDADPAGALDTYLGYLKREATMHAVLFAGMSTVRQLGFGGAAPCSLPVPAFDALLAHLRRHFRFMEGETGDHEAALAPSQADAGRLARLRGQGFSRIRLELDGAGAQAGMLAALVPAARAAGFRSVCVTLPYGVPGQEFGQLRRMLEAVIGAAPDRVLPCHRPGGGRDEDGIAAGSVAQRMLQLCSDHLDMASYTLTENEGYARLPGDTGEGRWFGAERRRLARPTALRHTQLVGCGVGARGAVGALACRNVVALYDYYALLDRNELPVARLLRREQTEPYLMQVKDLRDADQ